jgi:tRNA pseudouridine32 synthase/23S rRNA pseudouridine746 synthase
MEDKFIFTFKTALTGVVIPEKLNNPFGGDIPEIGRLAAREFQDYIAEESKAWSYDFQSRKGKMFGVLVVRKKDDTVGYIGAVSGKSDGKITCDKLVHSAFDDAADQSFIDDGMKALAEMGEVINAVEDPEKLRDLKKRRKQKSVALQQQLFENYSFLNLSGQAKNVIDIFGDVSLGNPPSASGDCAAPKLLHYAFKSGLIPIALAEFWWGNPLNSRERLHKKFYPACKSKCKPVLEYMLEDTGLYRKANGRFM